MVLEEDGHVRRLVEEARMVERVQVLLADRAQEFLSEPLEDLQLAIIDGCDGVHPHFVHVTSSTRLRSHACLAGWLVSPRRARRRLFLVVFAGSSRTG
jgi:hypothetical protein